MTATTLRGVLSVLLVTSAMFASNALLVSQSATEGAPIGHVRLTKAVLADGRPLAPGTYQIRLTGDQPVTPVGASPGAERWVEFVKAGKVAGREVATVISATEVRTIAKGPQPRPNASRVDVLKDGDYVRLWLNSAGTNYIVNVPFAR
jgi:hypothetical protein